MGLLYPCAGHWPGKQCRSHLERVKSYTEVNLNYNLEIRGTCMEFREGEKQVRKKKINRQVNDDVEGTGLLIKINHLVPGEHPKHL